MKSKSRLDSDRVVIVLDTPRGDYEVDLSTFRTPAEIGSWKEHLSKKTWWPDVRDDFTSILTALADKGKGGEWNGHTEH